MRALIVMMFAVALAGCAPSATPPQAVGVTQPSSTQFVGGGSSGAVVYVPGSSQKVCQLTGETDHETGQPTASQTISRFGLFAADLGYSFEHDGKLFFLFGDAIASPTFHGKPNRASDPPRMADDNDAIGFTTDTSLNPCVRLDFTTDSIGAYKNPVVLNAQRQPAITLRVDEIPISGISDAGRMYVIFGTDNYVYPSPGPSQGNLGFGTRTVVGASDDDANSFHYLYDFSKGPGAKFINVAIAASSDGYLYFWGTQGGMLWRHSPPFLARKPIGSMDSPAGMQYLHALNSDGTPVFMPSESDATALFHDQQPDAAGSPQVVDCMGELGVEWNPFVKRWVMLYNCADRSAANPNGIYMRTALQPWGPWSAPQTIFNTLRDGGDCRFVYHPVTAQYSTSCPGLSDPNRTAVQGGVYGPYFVAGFTTGDAGRATSTIYYTMATWNPYGQVIMKTTIQASQ